ncbi:hypothetical protein BGZ76_009178 [Entomortierella beljakovae]|nr:hypothetical protein BGZ76_009178 [Entomortierella beljakovae]
MTENSVERDEKDSASAVKRTAEPDHEDSVEDDVKSMKDVPEEGVDELEGEEYEVEKVVGHKRERGVLSFLLKWQGYGDADNTWETSDNLSCSELINEYWVRYEKAGGKKSDLKGSEKAQAAKRGASSSKSTSRKSTTPTASTTSPVSKKKSREDDDSSKASTTKKQKVDTTAKSTTSSSDSGTKSKSSAGSQERKGEGNESDYASEDAEEAVDDWVPPKSWTSWDEHLNRVQTIERSKKSMIVHLSWKNGKDTEHPIEVAHVKCPQTLIRFYESHLKFTQA